MFIPDLDFFPIPDPGFKKAPDHESATLLGTMLAFMDPNPATKPNPDRIRNTGAMSLPTLMTTCGIFTLASLAGTRSASSLPAKQSMHRKTIDDHVR